MEVEKIIDEDTNKKYRLVLPANLLNDKVRAIAEKKQPNYKLDGFRTGKVPVEEILKKEEHILIYNAVDDIFKDTITKIIKDNDLLLANEPEVVFENNDIKIGNDVIVNVSFETVPNIDIDYNKISINKYKVVINDKDINESFDKVIENYKKLEKKDAPAENNDVVAINFEGFINGESFDGGKGEDFRLKLGSKTFIDNFEDQLIGKKAGDKVDVNVRFPDNYHNSKFAGKDALFKVEVLEVLSQKDEDINDEFIKNNLGIESVEKLKDIIRTELENNYESLLLNKYKEDVSKKIDEVYDFDISERVINEKLNNFKANNPKVTNDEAKEEVIKNLRITYFLLRVAHDNNIEVTDSELTEAIMRQASYFRGNEKEFLNNFKNNYQLQNYLRSQLLEDKVFKFVIEKISSEPKNITVEELAKLQ